jgi:hypothetical protein
MERESTQSMTLPAYRQPEMRTYSEEELKERFADVFSDAVFFNDSHSSPGM